MRKKRCEYDPDTDGTECCWFDEGLGKYECKKRENVISGKGRWKVGSIVVLLMVGLFVIPYGTSVLISFFGTDAVEKDVYMYSENRCLAYRYNNGSEGDLQGVSVDIEVLEDGMSLVKVKVNGTRYEFGVESDTGYVNGTERYAIFWVFVPNMFFSGADRPESYNITDPAGLIGEINGNYTMVLGEKDIWWSNEKYVYGGQASYNVDIYDEDDNRVGTGLIDLTSGILERFEGNTELTLENPYEFPMSRFRLSVIWWVIGIGLAMPIVIALILYYKQYTPNEIVKGFIISLMGSLAIMVDLFLDVWFYAFVGVEGTLIIHFLMLASFVFICFLMKINPWWSLPIILETTLIMMVLFVAGYSQPILAGAFGSIITAVAIAFRSRISHRSLEGELLL